MQRKADGTFVVSKDRGGWLRVADIFEGHAFWDAELSIGVRTSKLSLGGRANVYRDAC